MSVCGTCEHKLHHYGKPRQVGMTGEACGCQCSTMPLRPENDKRRKPGPPPHVRESYGQENEVSKEIAAINRQIVLLWREVKIGSPTTVAHQCTISPEFVEMILTKLKQLELRLEAIVLVYPQNGAGIVPLEEVERKAILDALSLCHGNVPFAAEALRVGQATLYRKVKTYGITMKEIKRSAKLALPENSEVSPTTPAPAECGPCQTDTSPSTSPSSPSCVESGSPSSSTEGSPSTS